jgi:hypothetical protein
LMLKGQLVFEFVIAAVIMFSIIVYSISFLNNRMDAYHTGFVSNSMESKAVKVTSMLLNQGCGIVGEWPMLDSGRCALLESECENDYDSVLARFGLERRVSYDRPVHLQISIEGLGGASYMTCGNSPPERVSKVAVTRFVLLPSREIARLRVTVW